MRLREGGKLGSIGHMGGGRGHGPNHAVSGIHQPMILVVQVDESVLAPRQFGFRVGGAAPFAITSNNGNNFLTNTSQATLTGTAPIQVKTIQINGVTYALNWTTLTNWSLVLPLRTGTNSLVFQGFDAQDTALTNATDTLTITNLGPGVPLPVLINEWMADNAGPDGFADPLDGLFKNWFELYNPNPDPVNLSGFYLTDDLALPTQWRIPTNSLDRKSVV